MKDIWKLQFQVFIGSQVLVDCNGAVSDLINVQCPPRKWLQMHSCNIQDHAIGMKANIDPPKINGFFSPGWLVTLVTSWATTYYLFIPVSLESTGKYSNNLQSFSKGDTSETANLSSV